MSASEGSAEGNMPLWRCTRCQVTFDPDRPSAEAEARERISADYAAQGDHPSSPEIEEGIAIEQGACPVCGWHVHLEPVIE